MSLRWPDFRLSFRLLGGLSSLVSWGQTKVASRQSTLMLKMAREAFFQPRPDDIFIASYPKSGATLLQMMLYQMTTAGEMDFPHIEAVAPWYERAILSGGGPILEALASPRVFKSHAHHELLPSSPRFIYVAREVRDVAVSSFHHYCLITGVDHDFEEFLDQFIAERFMFGSWFAHIESWWPRRHDDNVLFLIFDEIVADLESTARKIAKFCDITLDEKALPRILERCDIRFMKQHKTKFDPRLRRLAATPVGPFIDPRRDRQGLLNARQEETLTKRLDVVAAELGWSGEDPVSRVLR